jgi:hypothetical protein
VTSNAENGRKLLVCLRQAVISDLIVVFSQPLAHQAPAGNMNVMLTLEPLDETTRLHVFKRRVRSQKLESSDRRLHRHTI